MGIGIRIENLRKVYHSPPPAALGGRGRAFRGGGRIQKREKVEILAVNDVSLEIPAGATFGLLGPNGAGKSTTISILTTRTEPTSGRVFVGEFDVWKQPVKAKRVIGVVPRSEERRVGKERRSRWS